jgi:sugar phosphate isomerase/epimerase
MFAFSTCWNSQRHTDGRAMLNEIRALGFDCAELGHATRLSLLDGIKEAVAANEIRISSLHNFCPLPLGMNGPAPDRYRPSSRNERERELAVRHTLRTIDCAAGLGAKAVVLHLGLVPVRDYTLRLLRLSADAGTRDSKFQRLLEKALKIRARKRQPYLDQVFRTLDAIVPRAKAAGVKLGLETRFGIREIPSEDEVNEILLRFGSEALGYWHDVGHAQVKENLGITSHEALLGRFRGRTAGMHLQDIAPPAFDHQPPGFGTFDFTRLSRFVSDDMILTWEIHHEWKVEQIVDSVKRAQELLNSPVNA